MRTHVYHGASGRSNCSDARVAPTTGGVRPMLRLQGFVGVKVLFVRRDPIRRDVLLGGGEIQLPVANQIVQAIFKRILHARVPDGRGIGLRPQVSYVVGAAESGSN